MLNLQEAPKFSPPPIAVLANVAVFAGAALFAVFAVFALFPGFAVISFGRAGVAAVSIGGLRKTDADSASDTLCETHEQVEGETARPLQEEEPTIAASPEARPQRSEPMSGAPRSRSLYRLTAMGLALAIVAAVAALWSRPLAEDVKRRAAAAPSVSEGTQAPRKTPSVRFPAQPAAPGLFAVVPVADDRPGELVWRSGYRALTERIDDGANVSRLALPRRACSAEALLAFGSASSDGAPDANARLARRRALWAAEWARRELASCPPGTTAPEILAISLGQAEGSPDARDRRVRLLAIERGTGLLFSDRAALRRSSAATFPDIQRFSAFELCVAPSSTASHLNMAPCR
jgi:hypothetical protein